MIDHLQRAYTEPLFWLFPIATTAVAMASFAVFAGVLTWLAAIEPASLRRHRIQRRRPRRQELVGPSIRSFVRNNAWNLAGFVVVWPVLRLVSTIHAGPLPPWWVVAGQVLSFVYVDDFLYYWFHRGMHTPRLYKRVHGWHHRIVTPWAVTGNYMHPLEYGLTGAVALVGPMLVGAHVVTLWIWFTCRQWEAAEGHCGYDLPWTPTHFFPFNDGAVHHDVHHERVRGNYAGFFPLWDRVFGTYARGYEAELAERRAA